MALTAAIMSRQTLEKKEYPMAPADIHKETAK
jgi:hypothetical protein